MWRQQRNLRFLYSISKRDQLWGRSIWKAKSKFDTERRIFLVLGPTLDCQSCTYNYFAKDSTDQIFSFFNHCV